jgi:hypothetical protein
MSSTNNQMEKDIRMAARSTVPILITAMPDRALSIARKIADAVDGQPRPNVLICDPPGDTDRLLDVVSHLARPGAGAGRSILLLRELHEWNPAALAAVRRLVHGDQPPVVLPRIVASSSVSLFDRVVGGTFDDELFYALNAIHIVALPGH